MNLIKAMLSALAVYNPDGTIAAAVAAVLELEGVGEADPSMNDSSRPRGQSEGAMACWALFKLLSPLR